MWGWLEEAKYSGGIRAALRHRRLGGWSEASSQLPLCLSCLFCSSSQTCSFLPFGLIMLVLCHLAVAHALSSTKNVLLVDLLPDQVKYLLLVFPPGPAAAPCPLLTGCRAQLTAKAWLCALVSHGLCWARKLPNSSWKNSTSLLNQIEVRVVSLRSFRNLTSEEVMPQRSAIFDAFLSKA